MGNDERREPTGAGRFGVLAAGLIILLLLLLPPVKGLLNSIPYLWAVLYPLLTALSVYAVATAIRAREPLLFVAKPIVLLLAAACMTAYFYGAAPIFFTVGRWSALLFIAAEVIHLLVGGIGVPAKAGKLEI
jgi:hypothetical protein